LLARVGRSSEMEEVRVQLTQDERAADGALPWRFGPSLTPPLFRLIFGSQFDLYSVVPGSGR